MTGLEWCEEAGAVLGRGIVAGFGCGVGTGLVVSVCLAPLAFAYGMWFGGIAGLCVGVPCAVVLSVLSPLLPGEDDARLASLAVAAVVGAALLLVLGAPWWWASPFGGLCAIIGAMVGRWVVFGKRRRVDPLAKVKQWQ